MILRDDPNKLINFFVDQDFQGNFFYVKIDKKNIININKLNNRLRKIIQEIGKEKKKRKLLLKGKVFKEGRPKDKLSSSKYDKYKNQISYRLRIGKSTKEIFEYLKGYNNSSNISYNGLRHYINTRFIHKAY